MTRYVDIAFDCLPLRSVGRFDIPLDASPKFRHAPAVKDAIEHHGSFNSFYLYNATCTVSPDQSRRSRLAQFRSKGPC